MNPLRLAPRLVAMMAFAVVAGTSLLSVPSAALAQRVQDAPAAASTGGAAAGGAPAITTVTSPLTSSAVPPAAGTHGSVPVKAGPKTPLTPAQQAAQQAQAEQLINQLGLQQAAAQTPKSPIAKNFPWLTHLFASIFLISAVGLVLLLAFQTTKQEGLSGTIGGRVEAAYKPRLGFDQQLQRITSVAAITMVIFATVVSLTGI